MVYHFKHFRTYSIGIQIEIEIQTVYFQLKPVEDPIANIKTGKIVNSKSVEIVQFQCDIQQINYFEKKK